MKRNIIFLGVLFTLVFSGCSMKEYKLFQSSDEITTISQESYDEEVVFENIIAPNDRVDITVYIQAGQGSQQMTSILTSRETNTSNPIQENIGLLVTQKGTVRLPLIGSFKVVGLTQDQASNMLIKEYKKYIRNPYVLVEIKNQRVIVIGEVKNPGIVSVTNGTMNIIEAIARSGDLTDYASRVNVKVIRGDLRKPEIRNIDITNMSALSLSSLYLKPNDILYVQPRDMKGFNQAFNEISPLWNTISSILNPFVQRKTLID
ncbi:polysaccharide biosynthesis/export family protein [Poseidonibacter lekithochrous]|uniref:polysaccharide biosynthesis/export family protein n=1 Tax=Poseidonibacter TaxID=2321187 RepID=UPI001C08380D|nr:MULTISPECIES: polysaccharide biosynthesis/export family protein [Poseidonibacter]MBU3015741.1 polysaccharide biosynthesis/export family protein [Poseidonibacter lekithochrous]MDO6829041.1 polysaccharide biosynthesis/export family protein [Poseidonibacter sp. 1_MG-2023]